MPAAPRRLSLKKRLLFSTIVLLACWGLIELASAYLLTFHNPSVAATRKKLHDQAENSVLLGVGRNWLKEDQPEFKGDMIHPYLGFVRQPSNAISEFGFPGQASPIHHRRKDTLVVGITGGSVAEMFAELGGPVLAKRLEASERFRGQKVVIVPLALSSYKQPQQLLTLTWLLSLGAEFDLLINLDGYNELVLPQNANVPHQVFPGYPREWHLRVANATDIPLARHVGKVTVLREAAQRWARTFDGSVLRYSPTALLIWQRVNAGFIEQASQSYAFLNTEAKKGRNPAATGPREKFASDDELRKHCREIWERCSRAMHALAESQGIEYHHVLQPNQYLPGSKTFAPEELNGVLDQTHEGKPIVEKGYPELIAAGKTMRADGVRFHDLTQVFASVKEPLYFDTCCHFNERGNVILAEAIARAILE